MSVNFTSSDSLIAADHSSFRNMAALTICCWLKRNGSGGGGDRIVSGWNDSTNKKTFQFYLNSASLAMEINCDTTGVNFQPSSPLSNDIWYHLAAVYTGETLYLYKDGAEISNTTTPSGDIKDEESGIGIGSQPDRTSFGFLNAEVKDVFIWNVALSASEIDGIYRSKIKRYPLQLYAFNRVLYLPLDDFADGTSGNGLNFKAFGASVNHDFVGNDGGNGGLTVKAEDTLSYPFEAVYVDAQDAAVAGGQAVRSMHQFRQRRVLV